jgi:hypothetical protein
MSEHVADDRDRYADALDRAWRSFKQNILIDALVTVGAGLTVLLGEAPVTSLQFWSAVGVLVIKSVLASTASYLHRLKGTGGVSALKGGTRGG